MKPAPFAYHAPRTIEAAVALLGEFASEEGRILAGGQSLVPAMALRLARPGHLIDINDVTGLDRLAVVNGALSIGACVRHLALDASAAPGPLGRLLGTVQRHVAHPPIRARGTFCGSLAHADAAAEWCLLAVALDVTVELRSTRGTRYLAADDFLRGYMTTALAPDEMIVAARIPLLPAATRCGFYEFSRRAGDFAQVAALATYEVRNGVMQTPRVALGGLGSRPHRMKTAEAQLVGQRPGPAVFEAAAAAAAGSGDGYEAALAKTAVLRALQEAVLF